MLLERIDKAWADICADGFVLEGSRKCWLGRVPFPDKWENTVDVFGLYQKPDGSFIGFVTDAERGLLSYRFCGSSEQIVIDKMLYFVQRELYIEMRKMILSDRSLYEDRIRQYLEGTCGYSNVRACHEVSAFLQDENVFFEMTYFVETGCFVPDRYAYRVCGYSAQQLCTDTVLVPVGAFHYLLYLKTDEKGALSNLKRGLPRK